MNSRSSWRVSGRRWETLNCRWSLVTQYSCLRFLIDRGPQSKVPLLRKWEPPKSITIWFKRWLNVHYSNSFLTVCSNQRCWRSRLRKKFKRLSKDFSNIKPSWICALSLIVIRFNIPFWWSRFRESLEPKRTCQNSWWEGISVLTHKLKRQVIQSIVSNPSRFPWGPTRWRSRLKLNYGI